MRRLALTLLVLILLSACAPTENAAPASSPAVIDTTTPTATPIPVIELRHGVNMGNMLEAPNEGDWGLTVHEEYFDLIQQAGFDFVRLPVRWNAHAEESAPYTIDPAFFRRIDEVVGWALKRNLTIIIDFHHYEELMSDPWDHKDRFLAIWKQIAEHYKDHPPTVLFELLNEPSDQIDAAMWNQYASEALSIVRESNPTRDVIIGPVQWNSFNWITTLDVPNDSRLIFTFHYYEPFHFTHQGAEWVGPESQGWLGTTWDATDAEKAEITSNFDLVADWAKRHGNVRILLGEFGAYSQGDMASRVRWTTYVRSEAERHGFAWAYWEFGSGFGAYDPDAHQWRGKLLKALIP